MKLLYLVFLVILNSSLFSDTINTKEDKFSNDYLSANIKYILKDNTLIIKTKVKNLYRDAKGGISISFPQLKNSTNIVDKSSSGFSSVKLYPPNSKLWSSEKKETIKSNYILIEGWSNKWNKNKEKILNIIIDTQNMDKLIVNFRSVLIKNKKEKKLPDNSDDFDQQSYPVKQTILTFNHTTDTSNTTQKEKNYQSENTRPMEISDFILDYNTLPKKEVCLIGDISSYNELTNISDRTNDTASINLDISNMPRKIRKVIMQQCQIMLQPCKNIVVCGIPSKVLYNKGLIVTEIK